MLLSVLTVAPVTVNAAVDNSESVSATSGDFVYEVLDDTTASIISYNGSETNLTIPSTLDGYTVTEIDWGAFEDCTSFTSVIIPNSIKRISGYAFINCVNLKSVTIPRNVFIGTRALGYIYDEESSAYKTVDGFTIYGCAGSVAEDYAVDNGFAFVSINLASDFYYEVINEAEMEVSITDYIGTETDLEIPSTLDGYTVKVVESAAFEGCTSLTSVTIPDSVKYIGVCAFKNCTSLSEITIPGSVTGIANSAFTGCSNVTVYGYYGTYAEVYAYSKDLLFIGLDQPTTEPIATEPEDIYIVAGNAEVFGVSWDGTAVENMMTDTDGDGVYTLTITDVEPIYDAQFRIVKNGTEWIGPYGSNYSFNVVEVCDVTISYTPFTGKVSIDGTGVTEVEFVVESMRAVGNGGYGWLNDIAWNPSDDANLMTEVSDGVYQLVMTDVEGNSDAELKFAANDSWSDNWGGTFAGFDVETDAVYNGENIEFAVGEGEYDTNLYTITLTLDLSNFDYATKTGAKFMVSQQVQPTEPETTAEVEETTVEPTAVEETTAVVEEPTEVEETTAEPTTAVPTTAKPEEPTQPTDIYIVAGSGEVFGANWDATAVENMMTDTDGDGVYTLTLKDVQPIDKAQFKIVKNGVEWIGPEIGNYEFCIIEACDVTITFNPETLDVQVAGAGVTEVELIIDSVRAVGNGGAGWLNDVVWDPVADENLMTEIAPGIYQIVFYDVEGNDNAYLKFAANGSWSDNWGGTFAGFDVETEAVYNGVNIEFVIGEGEYDTNLYTITLTLDLSNFDYATKTGAKFMVSQQVQPTEPETTAEVEETTEVVEEPTEVVEETTAVVEEPTEVEETTAEPTTAVPTTAKPEDPTPSTDTFIVAGSAEVFGKAWDETAVENMMTDTDGDGVYTLTLKDVQPIQRAEYAIVVNGTEWIIPSDIYYYEFNVIETCDVTISYNYYTGEISVYGTGVTEVELVIESMRAVGNGVGNWLNGIDCDETADENLMEEIAPGVYQLVMTDVEALEDAILSFAANGSLRDQWGCWYEDFLGFDVESEASYMSSIIIFSIGEGEYDTNLYTITLTLDLSNFNYTTKKGAKFMISQQVQPTEPETTAEVEETTEVVEEPTEVVEETTAVVEEPTEVVEETTAVVEEPTEAPEETTAEPEVPTEPIDTYIVAGSAAVFGKSWDGTAVENMMTDTDGDGVYTLTIEYAPASKNVEFQIVKNGTEWISPGNGNYSFKLVETCDVTISYNPSTGEVTVEGLAVTEVDFIFDSVRVVGNGDEDWLNGAYWDPTDDANLMTEVCDNVYRIVLTDVKANPNAQIRFAADGSWVDNWGGVFEGFDEFSDAVYNGDAIQFTVGEGDNDNNLYTITITLQLNYFNYALKTDAYFTISQQVQPTEPEETTEPDPTEPEETTEPEVIGDADGDGIVTINDVSIIQKYLVNLIDLTDEQLALADANKDGEVLIDDATLIQKYLAGLVEI